MTDTHWETARKLFREACMLRATGDESAAVAVLAKDMPGAVSAWMGASSLPPLQKKEELQEMFQEEMRRIDESVELCDMMLARFEETIALQIGSILHDFQTLLYDVFGLDTSGLKPPATTTAPRKKPRAKAPSKKATKQAPPQPTPDEMAERLRKFKEARLRTNKNWQSILFNDLEKIIDTVLAEPPKSKAKTAKPKTQRKSTRAKTKK